MVHGAYERARDVRDLNQACAGDFQVSVSKTLRVPFDQARPLLVDPTWLAPTLLDAARSAELKSKDGAVWRRLRPGEGVHELRLARVDDTRTRVVVQVSKLDDADSVERERARWKGALKALQDALSG